MGWRASGRRGGHRLPLVEATEEEQREVARCLERLGLAPAASAA
ncbi:MAG TPA: hypothetical protein VNT23_01975 [Gaiellaceae bacterium]|nr:hypothetical protein [Gaiellaceae bacterium]